MIYKKYAKKKETNKNNDDEDEEIDKKSGSSVSIRTTETIHETRKQIEQPKQIFSMLKGLKHIDIPTRLSRADEYNYISEFIDLEKKYMQDNDDDDEEEEPDENLEKKDENANKTEKNEKNIRRKTKAKDNNSKDFNNYSKEENEKNKDKKENKDRKKKRQSTKKKLLDKSKEKPEKEKIRKSKSKASIIKKKEKIVIKTLEEAAIEGEKQNNSIETNNSKSENIETNPQITDSNSIQETLRTENTTELMQKTLSKIESEKEFGDETIKKAILEKDEIIIDNNNEGVIKESDEDYTEEEVSEEVTDEDTTEEEEEKTSEDDEQNKEKNFDYQKKIKSKIDTGSKIKTKTKNTNKTTNNKNAEKNLKNNVKINKKNEKNNENIVMDGTKKKKKIKVKRKVKKSEKKKREEDLAKKISEANFNDIKDFKSVFRNINDIKKEITEKTLEDEKKYDDLEEKFKEVEKSEGIKSEISNNGEKIEKTPSIGSIKSVISKKTYQNLQKSEHGSFEQEHNLDFNKIDTKSQHGVGTPLSKFSKKEIEAFADEKNNSEIKSLNDEDEDEDEEKSDFTHESDEKEYIEETKKKQEIINYRNKMRSEQTHKRIKKQASSKLLDHFKKNNLFAKKNNNNEEIIMGDNVRSSIAQKNLNELDLFENEIEKNRPHTIQNVRLTQRQHLSKSKEKNENVKYYKGSSVSVEKMKIFEFKRKIEEQIFYLKKKLISKKIDKAIMKILEDNNMFEEIDMNNPNEIKTFRKQFKLLNGKAKENILSNPALSKILTIFLSSNLEDSLKNCNSKTYLFLQKNLFDAYNYINKIDKNVLSYFSKKKDFAIEKPKTAFGESRFTKNNFPKINETSTGWTKKNNIILPSVFPNEKNPKFENTNKYNKIFNKKNLDFSEKKENNINYYSVSSNFGLKEKSSFFKERNNNLFVDDHLTTGNKKLKIIENKKKYMNEILKKYIPVDIEKLQENQKEYFLHYFHLLGNPYDFDLLKIFKSVPLNNLYPEHVLRISHILGIDLRKEKHLFWISFLLLSVEPPKNSYSQFEKDENKLTKISVLPFKEHPGYYYFKILLDAERNKFRSFAINFKINLNCFAWLHFFKENKFYIYNFSDETWHKSVPKIVQDLQKNFINKRKKNPDIKSSSNGIFIRKHNRAKTLTYLLS